MFGSPLALLMLIGTAVLVMVSAELARTAYAKLTRMQIRRNRLFMLAPSGQDSRGKRLGAIAIGPVGSYLAISAIAFGLYQCHGIPAESVQLIGDVTPGFPAEGVLLPGDRIVELDGKPFVDGALQIHETIERQPGKPLALVVERDGVRRTENIAPKLSESRNGDGRPRYLLGVILKPDLITPGIATASGLALAFPYRQIKYTVASWANELFGTEADPGGPVRIASEIQSAYDRGPADVIKLGMMLGIYWLLALIGFDLVRIIIVLVRR